MADTPADHDTLIQQFCNLTGTSPHEAEQYLATNQWDLSSAAAEYYTSQEEGIDEGQAEGDTEVPMASGTSTSNPRGGTPNAPQAIPTTSKAPPPSSVTSTSKVASGKKFATLGDLNQGQAGSHGHGQDDDDDDEDFDPDKPNMFAGGEKSGLAVRNPDPKEQVRKILAKAKKAGAQPGGEQSAGQTSSFTGTARTLGGDDKPSEIIPDPNAAVPQAQPTQQRILHLWRDGFSVDDGDLYRFDDPANAAYLRSINQGQAPLAIMNVLPNQPVDVAVNPHKVDYVKPKKKYTPFGGGGQRLGSPTSGVEGSDSSTNQSVTISDSAGTEIPPETSAPPATIEIDESQPTISLQIRLVNGTRLVTRFNTTHAIGDVYAFVENHFNDRNAWFLMTTFPSKELRDKSVVLGELPELRRGGVVVQSWDSKKT